MDDQKKIFSDCDFSPILCLLSAHPEGKSHSLASHMNNIIVIKLDSQRQETSAAQYRITNAAESFIAK